MANPYFMGIDIGTNESKAFCRRKLPLLGCEVTTHDVENPKRIFRAGCGSGLVGRFL
jgi:hypothetical protein